MCRSKKIFFLYSPDSSVWTWWPLPQNFRHIRYCKDQVHDLLLFRPRGPFLWRIKPPSSSWPRHSLHYQRPDPNKKLGKWAGPRPGPAHRRTLLPLISYSRSGNPISHLGRGPEPSTHGVPINFLIGFKGRAREVREAEQRGPSRPQCSKTALVSLTKH